MIRASGFKARRAGKILDADWWQKHRFAAEGQQRLDRGRGFEGRYPYLRHSEIEQPYRWPRLRQAFGDYAVWQKVDNQNHIRLIRRVDAGNANAADFDQAFERSRRGGAEPGANTVDDHLIVSD